MSASKDANNRFAASFTRRFATGDAEVDTLHLVAGRASAYMLCGDEAVAVAREHFRTLAALRYSGQVSTAGQAFASAAATQDGEMATLPLSERAAGAVAAAALSRQGRRVEVLDRDLCVRGMDGAVHFKRRWRIAVC